MAVPHPPLHRTDPHVSGLSGEALLSRLRAWADRRRWLLIVVGVPTLLGAI